YDDLLHVVLPRRPWGSASTFTQYLENRRRGGPSGPPVFHDDFHPLATVRRQQVDGVLQLPEGQDVADERVELHLPALHQRDARRVILGLGDARADERDLLEVEIVERQ